MGRQTQKQANSSQTRRRSETKRRKSIHDNQAKTQNQKRCNSRVHQRINQNSLSERKTRNANKPGDSASSISLDFANANAHTAQLKSSVVLRNKHPAQVHICEGR